MKIKRLFKTGETGKLLKYLKKEVAVIPLVLILLPLLSQTWFKLNKKGKQANFNLISEVKRKTWSMVLQVFHQNNNNFF